jgi:NAD(P)-dependent dehydrogenase (short-subunit alcohol dehydrogenase family)
MLAVAGAGVAGIAAARARQRRAREIDLAGRVALVTGGSRGLGFALARELASQGARVAVCARGEEALGRAAAKLRALPVRCDVADRPQVEAAVAQVQERLGPIDVLVCNAGVISVGALRTQRHEDFAETMGIHFWGLVHPVLAVLPQMLERKEGRIANVTSIGGKISVPLLLPYNASKFAAVGLSEGLRAELAGTGVYVTTVVPGLMRTGSFLAAQFKEPQRTTYSLFTPISATPLTTISAERAARRIVDAVRHGDAEVTLTLHAKLAARAAGIAPALTADGLGLLARVLPKGERPEKIAGREIASPIDRSFVTAPGRRAAARLNQ